MLVASASAKPATTSRWFRVSIVANVVEGFELELMPVEPLPSADLTAGLLEDELAAPLLADDEPLPLDGVADRVVDGRDGAARRARKTSPGAAPSGSAVTVRLRLTTAALSCAIVVSDGVSLAAIGRLRLGEVRLGGLDRLLLVDTACFRGLESSRSSVDAELSKSGARPGRYRSSPRRRSSRPGGTDRPCRLQSGDLADTGRAGGRARRCIDGGGLLAVGGSSCRTRSDSSCRPRSD